MIKHIVMWKLKDFAEGNEKEKNAKIIKEELENLKEKIPEIKKINVGLNVNYTESQNWDVVLYSEFEKMSDLNIYQNHPEHKKIGEFVSKVRELRACVDYEE